MDVREMRNEALGKRVVKALESRNMEAYYVKTKEESTGTDSKGKYDQYGRFSFGERVRSDRCSLFR